MHGINDSPLERDWVPQHQQKTMSARILIVDDQADIRKLLRISLQIRPDTELYEAADGETGWAMAQEIRPDLVLLDVMMPGMDGYEVCRLIKSHPALGPRTRVVLISGKTQPQDIQRGQEAGCDAYLPKTTGPVKLLMKVDEVLGVADA